MRQNGPGRGSRIGRLRLPLRHASQPVVLTGLYSEYGNVIAISLSHCCGALKPWICPVLRLAPWLLEISSWQLVKGLFFCSQICDNSFTPGTVPSGLVKGFYGRGVRFGCSNGVHDMDYQIFLAGFNAGRRDVMATDASGCDQRVTVTGHSTHNGYVWLAITTVLGDDATMLTNITGWSN